MAQNSMERRATSLWTGGDLLGNVICGDAYELTWICEEEGSWAAGTNGLRHGSCCGVCLLIVTLLGSPCRVAGQVDLLDRLADQVHPACGQVLGPEQGDGVGECGGTHGYHCGFPSAADRWAPGPEAASVPLVGFTGHPKDC